MTDLQHIALNLIDDNPFQPRLSYDEERIAAIAASIREHGLLQVPIARLVDGVYQLAFGHSRLRAFQLLAAMDLRFAEMPLIVRELDDETMALHAWTENKDRKDLTSYEEIRAIERYTSTFGWTQKLTAEKLGLDTSTVSNKLRLLRLPAVSLAQLEAGELSERQAVALLPLADLAPATLESQKRVWVSGLGQVLISELLADAPRHSADQLRTMTKAVLDAVTIDLKGKEWAEIAFTRDGSDPTLPREAVCKVCPIRLKSTNRCPDSACAEWRRAEYTREKAAAAAEKEKLPALAPPDRIYFHHYANNLAGVNLSELRKVAKARGCGNLGVIWLEHDHYLDKKVKDHPGCGIVCLHGEGKRCACQASMVAKNPEASKAAAKRTNKKIVRDSLILPATETLAAALAQPTAGMLRKLLRHISYSADGKLPDDAGAETVREALAAALIKELLKYEYDYGDSDPDKCQEKLDDLLSAAGVTAPWAASAPKPQAAPTAPQSGAEPEFCAQNSDAADPVTAFRRTLANLEERIADGDVDAGDTELVAKLREELTDLADDPNLSNELWEKLDSNLRYARDELHLVLTGAAA